MEQTKRWITGALIALAFAACDSGGKSADDETENRDSGEDTLNTGGDDTGTHGDEDTSGDSALDPIGAISDEELVRLTSVLSKDEWDGRDEGTEGGRAAREFLRSELEKCHLVPLGDDGFEQEVAGGEAVNLIGKIEGTDSALRQRHVLLSAHFDHLSGCPGVCNGAYDNAAAVAIVVAVGCLVAENPLKRTVLIALWDAEEPPTFLTDSMGSQFFVQNPTVPLEQIDAAIVLDLAGSNLWPGYQGEFVLGAETSPELQAAFDRATVPGGLAVHQIGLHIAEVQPMGLQPWSDYDAFRNADKPVLFLSNGQNKYYHTAQDEMDIIDVPKLVREAELALGIVIELGAADKTPTATPQGSNYESDVASAVAILEEVLAPKSGLVDALGLGATSRKKLEQDLAAAKEIDDRVKQGNKPSDADARRVRQGLQRAMCLAGNTYEESLCMFL